MLNPPRAWTTISPDLWPSKERDTSYMWIKNEWWMNLQMEFDMWIIKIMFVFFFLFTLYFPSVFSHIHPCSQEVLNKINLKVVFQLFIRSKKFFRSWYLLGYPSKFLQSVKFEFLVHSHWKVLGLDIKISSWLCSVLENEENKPKTTQISASLNSSFSLIMIK